MREHSYTQRRSAFAGTLGLLLMLVMGALLVWRSEAAAVSEPLPPLDEASPLTTAVPALAATPLAVEGLAISAADGPIVDLNMWNWTALAPGSCVLLSAGTASRRSSDDQPCTLVGIANVDVRFFHARLTISSHGAPLMPCEVSLKRCTVSSVQ